MKPIEITDAGPACAVEFITTNLVEWYMFERELEDWWQQHLGDIFTWSDCTEYYPNPNISEYTHPNGWSVKVEYINKRHHHRITVWPPE